MRKDGARLHHVVGLVRPGNLANVVAALSDALEVAFYPIVERPQFAIKMAISLDAGIELIALLNEDAANPLVQSLDASGERWISLVIAVVDLEAACKRLERFGHRLDARQDIMALPQPFTDRIAGFEQASLKWAATGGLPIQLAQISRPPASLT